MDSRTDSDSNDEVWVIEKGRKNEIYHDCVFVKKSEKVQLIKRKSRGCKSNYCLAARLL